MFGSLSPNELSYLIADLQALKEHPPENEADRDRLFENLRGLLFALEKPSLAVHRVIDAVCPVFIMPCDILLTYGIEVPTNPYDTNRLRYQPIRCIKEKTTQLFNHRRAC